jgi:hypothetical protein
MQKSLVVCDGRIGQHDRPANAKRCAEAPCSIRKVISVQAVLDAWAN